MKKILATAFAIFLSYSAPNLLRASWSPHTFKDFTVTVEFRDFDYEEADGAPVYSRGETIAYRVVLTNNGHRPFRDLPVKGTLIWNTTASCTGTGQGSLVGTYEALQPLPGNSVSGPHYLTIGGDSYSFFDAFYQVPNNVCPNSVRIKLDAGKDSRYQSLILPERIVIR